MLMFIESLLLLNFNSHPHIEDDSDADQTVDYPKVFQFTSSYRG